MMLSRALFGALALSLSLSLSACAEEERPRDSSFGLPGKGDQSCDPKAPLCWDDADASAARALMEVESEVVIGELPLSALLEAIEPISHKLEPEEREALERLRALPEIGRDEGADAARAERIKELFDGVYGRPLSGYWGAHATLLAQALSPELAEGGEKADGASSAGIPSALPVPSELRPAFETLWAQGPYGQYLVTMLSLTGAAEHRPILTPIQDRDYVSAEPIDLEAARISHRFARYAAMESTLANLSSLIPVVGVWVSVPYGVFGQFKQRMKMAMELATLYGLNPRDPDELLLCVQLLTAAQGYKELFSYAVEALVGTQALKIFAERSPELLTDELSERRVTELKRLSLGQFGAIGARIMANILAQAGQGSAKALLGQVTLGISAILDVSLDYWNTLVISRELRYALHPWGAASAYEGLSWLAEPGKRSCAYALLTEVSRADGDVNEREAEEMLESLIRPFYMERGPVEGAVVVSAEFTRLERDWGSFLRGGLIIDHLSAALESSPYTCASEHFGEESSLTRLTLLAWLEVMAWSDLVISSEEELLLMSVGELLELATEEERVYHAMRERVAVNRYLVDRPSLQLGIWRGDLDERLADVCSDEVLYQIWELMR